MGIEHVDMERGRVKGKEKNRERIYIALWGGGKEKVFCSFLKPLHPRPDLSDS